MGVTSTTPYHLVFGAGQLTVTGGPSGAGTETLGATKENTVFRIEVETYFPDLDGTVGPVMGTGRINREVAYLEVTLTELELDWMVMALRNQEVHAIDSTYEYIGYPDDLSRCILIGDHFDRVVWTGSSCETETPTVPAVYRITLFNAICEENLEIGFTDDNEAAYRLVFMCTYDPADVDKKCFEIRRTPPSV